MRTLISCFIAITCLLACNDAPIVYEQSQPNLPSEPLSYAPRLAGHFDFPAEIAQQASAIEDHTATLGRVLFYDKKLSVNNRIACAGCHFQDQAFSDGKALSPGFARDLTSRNAMSIVNPLTQTSFFWDGRTKNLRNMVLAPVENHIEMGMEEMDELEVKLAAVSYYPGLFKNAFGDSQITRGRVSDALTQFLQSMTSFQSAYDEALTSDFANFSAEEKRGHDLFFGQAGCWNCHNGPDLRQWMPPWGNHWEETWANIGLEAEPVDPGAGAHNLDQKGVFRAPSLRNVALTAPYMHDGRFATLEAVIEHYNSGVVASDNLDWRLSEGNFIGNTIPRRLNLNSSDKQALVAFLHTLTDEHLTTDKKFSNPF